MIIVTEIATRIISTDEDGLTFAIKAKVKNGSDESDLYIELQGLDVDGFEIYSVMLDGNIPIGETKVMTDREEYVDPEIFAQIKEWRSK